MILSLLVFFSQTIRTIFETEFLVDLQKIQEENFKLTVLQDYNSTSSNTTSAAHRSRVPARNPFLNKSRDSGGSNNIHNSSHGGMSLHAHDNAHHNNHNLHGHGGSANTSSNSSAVSGMTGSLSTYSRSQGQQRIVRCVHSVVT